MASIGFWWCYGRLATLDLESTWKSPFNPRFLYCHGCCLSVDARFLLPRFCTILTLSVYSLNHKVQMWRGTLKRLIIISCLFVFSFLTMLAAAQDFAGFWNIAKNRVAKYVYFDHHKTPYCACEHPPGITTPGDVSCVVS